jgi:hypothetical protein
VTNALFPRVRDIRKNDKAFRALPVNFLHAFTYDKFRVITTVALS